LDYQSDAHIQALNEEIFRYEESLHKLEEKFKEITAVKKYVEDEVEIIKKKLPSSLDTRQKYRLHTQYNDLCSRQKELHKNYHYLLDAIVTFKGKIEELEAEKRRLMAEQVRVDPGVYLKVRGIAFEGNIVRGKITFMEFHENKKVIRAHETIIYRDREDGGQDKDVRIELEPM
jgi:chromosome segregation ATPase